MTQDELKAGQIFHGKYTLEEIIGRGATKTVWKAWDEIQERKTAISISEPGNLKNSAQAQRYDLQIQQVEKNEARVLTSLDEHPNVVTIYDANRDPATGKFFIAEQFIDGKSLEELMPEKPDKKWVKELREYARGLLRGLQHIHKNGISHNDIKLDNIIIDSEGNANLVDFGSAVMPGEDTGTPTSLRYLPPERAADVTKPGSPAGDMWQVGILLYKAITGKYPFSASVEDWTGASEEQIEQYRQEIKEDITRCAYEDFKSPDWYKASSLKELVDKLLKKDPEKRISAKKAHSMIKPGKFLKSILVGNLLAGAILGISLWGYSRFHDTDDSLIYLKNDGAQTDIYRSSTDFTNKRRLAHTDADEHSLSISPDGTKLAYLQEIDFVKHRHPYPFSHVMIKNLDDNTEQEIDMSDSRINPVWTGDSDSLLYISEFSKIKKWDSETETITEFEVEHPITNLRAKPDGEYASLICRDGDLRIIDLVTGKTDRISSTTHTLRSHVWLEDEIVFQGIDETEQYSDLVTVPFFEKSGRRGVELFFERQKTIRGSIDYLKPLPERDGVYGIGLSGDLVVWYTDQEEKLSWHPSKFDIPFEDLDDHFVLDATAGDEPGEFYLTIAKSEFKGTSRKNRIGRLDIIDTRMVQVYLKKDGSNESNFEMLMPTDNDGELIYIPPK